jgi:hypothetical protein
MAARSQFASHVGGYSSGIRADLMQEPGDRYAHSDEVKAGLWSRDTVLSDRCEMADKRLQRRMVAGG